MPNAPQTAEVKLALQGRFALFPLVCVASGIVLLTQFSLGRAEHARLRAEIDDRG